MRFFSLIARGSCTWKLRNGCCVGEPKATEVRKERIREEYMFSKTAVTTVGTEVLESGNPLDLKDGRWDPKNRRAAD